MFASLKRYIDFARSSDKRLPRIVAEIDVIASLIRRLVPSRELFGTIYKLVQFYFCALKMSNICQQNVSKQL